jgi:hypothetical protein
MALSKKGDWIELVKWRADVGNSVTQFVSCPLFSHFLPISQLPRRLTPGRVPLAPTGDQ